MTSLLKTKTQIPHTFGHLIERPRLLHYLDHIPTVPLTLLSAPAGFGKTTLLTQWISQRRNRKLPTVRAAWLSLDDQDGDLRTFLSYFVAALRTVYPDACIETGHLISSSEILSDQALAIALVNELDELGKGEERAEQPHVVLVLDDYDLVNNDAINTLLTAIMRHPPRRLHLVLVCRYDPALPLARWRTENQLLELRSKDLRLNRAEIEQFLRQAVPIDWSPAQIAALDERTEGWAAGLHLFALTMQDPAGAERIARVMGVSQQHVMNYLMEEVLTRLPSDIQRHLIQISTLNRFNAELCEAVCDDMSESGAEFIAELERANLFLVGLDDAGIWYRFHPLFRELLQSQLKLRHTPAERAVLHTRAMDWFAKTSSISEALAHAFAGGEVGAAAELVAKHRHMLMNYEDWPRLDRWLDKFPGETIAQYPDLLLAKAWVARVLSFDLVVTAVLAQQASNLLDAQKVPDIHSAALRAEVDVLRAMQVYRIEANSRRAIALIERALDVLPLEWSMVRMHAYLFLAAGFQVQGDLSRAIEVLHQGRTEEVMSPYSKRARALIGESFIHWMSGNLPAMLESARQRYQLNSEPEYSETGAWARYFTAAASYERNDLATAEASAAAALNDPNPWGNFRAAVDCAAILALVYQARNLPEQAREVLDDMLRWALEKHSDTLTESIRAFQAELALRQGDMVTANRWFAGFGNPTPSGTIPNFSSPFITAVRVLIAQNTPVSRRRAAESLARLETHLSAIHNVRFLIDVFALKALLHEQMGDRERAFKALVRALALAEPGGFIRPFVDLGEPMEKLLIAHVRRDGRSAYLAALLDAFRKAAAPATPKPFAGLIEPLSEREMHVLELLAKRLTNKEIAQELLISPLTVKAHTDHIYQKLGVNSRQDAVSLAFNLGLLPRAA